MRLDPAGVVPKAKAGRRTFRARCLLAVASGISLLVAAGCSNSGGAAGSFSGTLTIAAVPSVDDASIYLAQKDGLFAAEGLSVVIKSYATQSAALSAMLSAKADIAASDYGDIFYQQTQTSNLRILADGYDATAGVLEVLTLPGSSVKSPIDLANIKVGLPDENVLTSLESSGNPASLDAAAATDVLSDYLGNAADSVQWDPMPEAQEVSELEHHKLQAILVSQPYIYQAESLSGATEVLDAFSGPTANLPMLGYVSTSTWVKDYPTAAADFQAALAKAQANAALTGQVQSLLPKSTGMSVQDADLITIGSYPTTTSAMSLEQVVRLMTNYNMIKLDDAPDVPQMIVKPGG
jgi:NitT/TauT family transport system substrate-binding protein